MIRWQTQNTVKRLSPFRLAWLCLGMLLLNLGVGSLQAQLFTGSINGVVRDSTGSAVPGATVVAKNVATSDTRSTITSADGLYSLSPLNPGEYQVTVSHDGFQTSQQ